MGGGSVDRTYHACVQTGLSVGLFDLVCGCGDGLDCTPVLSNEGKIGETSVAISDASCFGRVLRLSVLRAPRRGCCGCCASFIGATAKGFQSGFIRSPL